MHRAPATVAELTGLKTDIDSLFKSIWRFAMLQCVSLSVVRTIATGAFFVWLAFSGASLAVSRELPEDLRKGLEHNASVLDPITVSWQSTITYNFNDIELKLLSLVFNPNTMFSSVPSTYTYYWQRGKFWLSFSHFASRPDSTAIRLTEAENGFDGVNILRGMKSSKALGSDESPFPNLCIRPLKWEREHLPDAILGSTEEFYFQYAGFKFPQFVREIGLVPQSSILWYLREGGKVMQVAETHVGATSCILVEIAKAGEKFQFYLDPAKGHAVRKLVRLLENGNILYEAENSEFEDVAGEGVWFPTKSAVRLWYLHNEKYRYNHCVWMIALQTKSFNLNEIPAKQFVVDNREPYTRAGTTIGDGRLPGAEKKSDGTISYVHSAGKAALDARKDVLRRHGFRVWLVTANVLILMALVGLVIWKRRRALGSGE